MAKRTIKITAQPGPQWEFLGTEADICVYGGAAGGGKAQPLSEPVLTPFGFMSMGSLNVGSTVVSSKGKLAKVIQVHPQGKVPVYRVKFVDGAETRCTADHLWNVSEKGGDWETITTKELREKLSKGKNFFIPLSSPADYGDESPDERYEDIREMMDVSGTVERNGACKLKTSAVYVAKYLQWLIWSIGGLASVTKEDGKYTVLILTEDNSKLFSSGNPIHDLKLFRCLKLRRKISAIEPCGEEECQCITIDDPEGLYVTKDFVVTHNSHALLLSPLMYKGVKGFNCTIFRRTFKQVFSPGGLWDTAQTIYSLIPNAQTKKSTSSWIFLDKNGEVISRVAFAHIERYEETQDWQGSQLCELCCSVDTLVLMEDGSYKTVADIKVGDCVQTLNGVYPVTAVGRERMEECVVVDANEMRQVQSANHKLLSNKGWVSYEDLIQQETDTFYCSLQSILSRYLYKFEGLLSLTCAGAFLQFGDLCLGLAQIAEWNGRAQGDIDTLRLFERTVYGLLQLSFDVSILCRSYEERGECFRQNIRALQQLLRSQYEGQLQERGAFQETTGHQGSLETYACMGRQGRESDSELSASKRRELLRHVLNRLRQELDKQAHLLQQESGNCASGRGESSCAPILRQFEDFQCCYYACRDLCDECIRYFRDTFQENVRQLDGVVIHNPICSHPCDKGKIPVGSRHVLQYAHPYIESLHFQAEDDVSLCSCRISPCGVRKVKPFTVSGMNYYITEHGFVNKNCFDELSHFDEQTFFYMLSRNRSTCGVKPFVRATCNPDADSWVAKFIEWWINQDTGYPIPERSGKIRWFIRRDGQLNWAETKEELWERFNLVTDEEREEPRSVTFIASSVYDNKALLKANPQYLANLKALPEVERERLLKGNWKIKAAAGLFFKRSQVTMIEAVAQKDIVAICRAWDIAATGDKESAGDPDFTSGVLMARMKNGAFVVLDVINQRIKAGEVEKLIYNTAVSDRAKWGFKYKVRIPQDPGAAGKIIVNYYIKLLAGFSVKSEPVSGSKQQRATPFASQWQNGNVEILIAPWNDSYFTQLESFPESKHDDMVDASSDSFNEVAAPSFNLSNML